MDSHTAAAAALKQLFGGVKVARAEAVAESLFLVCFLLVDTADCHSS